MSDLDKQKNQTAGGEKSKPSEFVIGITTFVIFIIFMTAWMYLNSNNW